MSKQRKILMLCSRSVTVAYFRMKLITDLIAAGYHVTVASLDRDREEEIRATGADFVCVDGNNRSTNPVQQLRQIRAYRKLIREQKPDQVFTFQAVPNMLGGIAARLEKVQELFCMVEGAGDVFANKGLKWFLLRQATCLLYGRAFKTARKVLFLNEADEAEFLRRRLVRREQCGRIHGIGVDLEKFAPMPIRKDRVFLMVSRLMESKGTLDFCEAARIVKKKHPEAIFRFLGEEFTLKKADIQPYLDDGSIEYLGYAKDVRPHLADCSVFVLPSFYREGLPMTIMEAMAVGRAVITTRTVGCDGTIVEGENGWYARMHDPEDLAARFIDAIEDDARVREMGLNARKYAEEFYDVKRINEILIQILKKSRGE